MFMRLDYKNWLSRLPNSHGKDKLSFYSNPSWVSSDALFREVVAGRAPFAAYWSVERQVRRNAYVDS
jgi:hypothetical protein